ncbi:stage II sporulation protein R [Caloramator fervidus]|uniref:Stage II sporulation protein R n=1 Tax=Caloramator fervidus TaxID=29344 RepID=A0A1H5RMG8_9CLOT|nr:stage II sporulation protein R [Caloramator fervidus]SEF38727.1 stage II sporulation protein R [Caloramator fervidus]
MRRIIAFLTSLVLFVFIFGIGSFKDKEDIIRFHVIANSDSIEDQSVKLKVRDRILKEFYPMLKDVKDYDESLKILKEDISKVEDIANSVLKENGFNYTAKAYIGKFNFPAKQYGDLVVPPGEYMALRVVLGKGEGKNWWCVMFPPLCFIDITRGKIDKESEEILKKALYEDSIDVFKTNKKSKIEFRLKSLEIISKAIKRAKIGAR